MAGRGGPMGNQGNRAASNVGEVMIELAPADERPLTSEEIGARWKALTGPIPEAVDLTFTTSIMNAGEDVNVQLMGRDVDRLREAAEGGERTSSRPTPVSPRSPTRSGTARRR